MRLTVTRHGGFAGLTRAWSIEIDELDDAEDWRRLLDSIDWAQPRTPPSPDRFVYRVQCGRRRAEIAESQLSEPWERLIRLARDHGHREGQGR